MQSQHGTRIKAAFLAIAAAVIVMLAPCAYAQYQMDPNPRTSTIPTAPTTAGFTARVGFDVAHYDTPVGVVLQVLYDIPGAEPPTYGEVQSVDMLTPNTPPPNGVLSLDFTVLPLPFPATYTLRYTAMHPWAQSVIVDAPVPVVGSGHARSVASTGLTTIQFIVASAAVAANPGDGPIARPTDIGVILSDDWGCTWATAYAEVPYGFGGYVRPDSVEFELLWWDEATQKWVHFVTFEDLTPTGHPELEPPIVFCETNFTKVCLFAGKWKVIARGYKDSLNGTVRVYGSASSTQFDVY